jgi:hypothetical protein
MSKKIYDILEVFSSGTQSNNAFVVKDASGSTIFNLEDSGKIRINDSYDLPTTLGNNDEIMVVGAGGIEFQEKETYVGGYVDTIKNIPGGIAGLDPVTGKMQQSIIPAVAVTDTYVVGNTSSVLGLTQAGTGDVAVVTDISKSFILSGTDSSVYANWQELLTPPDSVLSVNNQTGAVSLGLNNLNNVDISGASTGEVLTYQSGTWSSVSIPTIEELNDIGDVDVSGATTGQVLTYDGTTWSVSYPLPPEPVGIAINGEYTYYSTLADAVAAIPAGNPSNYVIELFQDIQENGDVTITLQTNTIIDFNGYTYIFNPVTPGTLAFNTANVSTTSYFRNGIIRKLTSGYAVGQSNMNLDFQNFKIINLAGSGISSVGADISGLHVIAQGRAMNGSSSPNLFNCIFESLGERAVFTTGGNARSFKFYTYGGDNTMYAYYNNNASTVQDCYAYSAVGRGFFIQEATRVVNCGSDALIYAAMIHCNNGSNYTDVVGGNFRSSGSYALYWGDNVRVHGSSIVSNTGNAIDASIVSSGEINRLENCTIKGRVIAYVGNSAIANINNCSITIQTGTSECLTINGDSPNVYVTNNFFDTPGTTAIAGVGTAGAWIVSNVFAKTITTPIGGSITNSQTLTPDSSGNIKIG